MTQLPKPRPKLLDKRATKAALEAVDRAERRKCHARSRGYCEVFVDGWIFGRDVSKRCERFATENHHLIGGIGRKNKGKSILAEHRLDVCHDCHVEITNHVLVPCVPLPDRERAATVRYERVR